MARSRLIPILAALALTSCSAGTARRTGAVSGGAIPGQTVTLSIVGTNDLHGGILQREDRGGLALLGGYVANLRAARARDGGAVLLIDGGDMFQGTLESNLTEGSAVVAAYNTLGYAAAAIGNHEFDFGPVGPISMPQRPGDDPRGALKARAAQASFPFLAANLIDDATGRPVAFPNVKPSTVVTAAGVKVGIVGVMTSRALSLTIAANVRGLRVAPLAATIEAEAGRLRSGGASLVVVAAHAGGRCGEFANPRDLSSCDESEEIFELARTLPPGIVDVIVAGHSHQPIGHQARNIAISEAYSGGRAFGRVDVVVDRATKRVLERRSFPPIDLCARVDPGTTHCDPGGASASRVSARYEGAAVTPDLAVERAIAPGVQAAVAQKAMPVGITLATPIRRVMGKGESALGNLVEAAYLAAMPDADVVINNTDGTLRSDLPAGPLTYGEVFETMPFDNRLVAFRLSGADVRRLVMTWVRDRFPALPGLAGLRARVSCKGSALDVTLLRPNNAPIGDDERLLVATSDFLATGGDRIFESITPRDGFAIERDAGAVRDVIVEALQRRGGILREDGLVDPANPHWTLPGPRPVTCGA
jgi:2',3'-cyclic-nucleotide 2'-phosphodiesterase (5'-nucleotidase family)